MRERVRAVPQVQSKVKGPRVAMLSPAKTRRRALPQAERPALAHRTVLPALADRTVLPVRPPQVVAPLARLWSATGS